jgi:hypothetical protein
MIEVVERSSHDLNGFVLIIVGTDPFPAGMRVSIYSSVQDEVILQPEGELADSVLDPDRISTLKSWMRKLFRMNRDDS